MYIKGISGSMATDQSTRDCRQLETATLGGGCFWCTEAVFSKMDGVIKVEPGYSGGKLENPTYEQVSTGTTGHAEVVQIAFDPNIISFRQILEVFFKMHDATTLNRQGADIGTQYRSVVFYHSREQKTTAEQLIEELDNTKVFDSPIVTQVERFRAFYEAEDYHKEYFKRHPEQSYCRLVIAPKIAKLREIVGASRRGNNIQKS
jgi:peptide-methionine (S)-S-oxide reductase